MVIMIAQRDAEYLFGFILLDDKTIEVLLDFPRLVIELKMLGLGFVLRPFAGAGAFRLRSGRRFHMLEMLPHEFR